ncbi:DUF1311 domain-containing protein [Noviherbaspirillum cavernae]|uniref:DUF1311 domain-containing protein n=1 Tax=Noviherbaspirillum cavernae TaxID=2320862 RepID=A0A418WZ82_9BURK|nr:DUF1311 domain-containing protein [Noviherbaspirillum cavernae]
MTRNPSSRHCITGTATICPGWNSRTICLVTPSSRRFHERKIASGISMRAILAFAFLFVFLDAFAAEADLLEESLKDCDKNQLAMNFCARHRFDLADKELNSLFKQRRDRLDASGARERLRAAQRAWLAFRDKDCLYEAGPREESGSIWPLAYFSCMERHTRRRSEDLKGHR